MKVKILLVEDDTNLGFVVSDHLRSCGYDVTLCLDGQEAIVKFNEEAFHLCIFDVMMPRKDGFSLTKDIRTTNKEIPILFLTAKSQIEDKAEGFKMGGDDYLTKPFSIEELEFRVKALLKRVNISMLEEEKCLNFGTYTFDIENYSLESGGHQTTLTKKEALILKMLVTNKNQVIPREVILNRIWGQDDYFVGRSLDVFITKLRKHLRADESLSIINVHGVGFKLCCDAEQ